MARFITLPDGTRYVDNRRPAPIRRPAPMAPWQQPIPGTGGIKPTKEAVAAYEQQYGQASVIPALTTKKVSNGTPVVPSMQQWAATHRKILKDPETGQIRPRGYEEDFDTRPISQFPQGFHGAGGRQNERGPGQLFAGEKLINGQIVFKKQWLPKGMQNPYRYDPPVKTTGINYPRSGRVSSPLNLLR